MHNWRSSHQIVDPESAERVDSGDIGKIEGGGTAD